VTSVGTNRFEAVWREQTAKLWRALLQLTGDPDIASDALTEAFAQARGRDLEADAEAGVVGVRVQRGAAALQFGGELLGGVLVGALGEGARHDRGVERDAR